MLSMSQGKRKVLNDKTHCFWLESRNRTSNHHVVLSLPPHKLHGKVKTTDDLFVINLLKSLKGFNYNICSFQVFKTNICSKVEVYMSRLYKHDFLSFLLQKAEKNTKPQTRNRKTFCPSNANAHSVSSFLFFNLFFNSGSRKYSKQTSEVFFHMRQVSSFPDYNRFLTSLRWDELIQVRRLRLKIPHHQLEVPFCATNESHGIGSLVHSHTNFPIIRDSHYHLYSLTKEILSVCHIFCLERWKNLFVLDRTPKIKFW